MKIVGIFCTAFLLSFILTQINRITGNGYIYTFINNDSIQIVSTLLGFNIAVLTILMGQISDLESLFNKIGHFKKTRSEMYQNAFFNIILIISIFLLRVFRIEKNSIIMKFMTEQLRANLNFFFEISILAALILNIFLIYDTLKTVFDTYEIKKKPK